jgi:hypothetical protein
MRPLLMCLLWTSLTAGAEEGLHWFDNYNAAIQEAKRTGKPIFLEFRCEP